VLREALMAELRVRFRLPETLEPAELVTDYGLRGGRLLIGGAALEVASREALAAGVAGVIGGRAVELRARDDGEVELRVGGVAAVREERLRAPTSRSAWRHAWLALSGSLIGFVASWLYLRRAHASGDAWAMKMAVHMAAWHLFLTLTLFPASVWGQRIGIRAVQLAALVFFFIHIGIALANVGGPGDGPLLGLLNASSGVAFLATVLYGQRAHADMDPLRHS
jgi:hypothetical protein